MTSTRRRLAPLLIMIALCAPLCWGVPGARAADVLITGRLVGMQGAANLGGTTVFLEVATAAGSKPEERTTTARDDGGFRFEGFVYNPNAVYLLKVVYDGGAYFREVVFADGAASADVAAIEVYPATRDARAITFARLNTIFSTFDQDNGAQAIETGAYRNDSGLAYVGQPGTVQGAMTVRFGLPQSALRIEPAQGLDRDTLVSLDEPPLAGFATIEAAPPGERQFAFIYRIQTRGDSMDLDRVFPYRTELYTLYLPVNARLVSGGSDLGFRDSGEQTLQNGQKFRVFTANNIPPGGRLIAHFSGLPTPATEVNPLVPAMILFVLLIGIGLIVVYGRKRGPSAVATAATRRVRTVPGNAAKARPTARTGDAGTVVAAGHGAKPGEDLVARKERLLLALVELDERHEAGDLDDAEYRRLRRARKNALVATLRALGPTEPDADAELSRPAGRRRS